MDYAREIYWNVGTGVLVPMYALAALAVAVAAWGLWRRIGTWRRGRALGRTDAPGARAARFARDVLLQARVRRGGGAGTAHALFFWSFLVLLAGTTLVFVQADITDPLLGYRFLRGRFYLGFSLALDLAGLLALVTLGALLVRRYALRPPGLESRPDHALMHALLFAALVTGFLVEGLRIAATELHQQPFLAHFSPVGRLLALPFADTDPALLGTAHAWLWWVHLAVAMAFIAAIPFTRLRHIVTTSVNSFLADRARGKLETLDFDDEAATSFGAATVEEFRWKDLLDADACTLCKRCQDACPAFAAGKTLSPMRIVTALGESASGAASASVIEAATARDVWACTTCRACEEACPASIEHVAKIVAMRRHLVMMRGEFAGDEVRAAMETTEVNGNPLGAAPASRAAWAGNFDLASSAADADVLYFPGCYAAFDPRNVAVARSFVAICRAAGVRVALLGKTERCCGEPVRRMGNEYLYQALAAHNIEAIGASGAKTVVTTCPHCFATLRNDYPDLGLEVEVVHYTTFLDQLVRDGRLALAPAPFECTYHDSCTLARGAGITAPPRALIAAAGGTIAEMERRGENGFCCGAGGGRILADESPESRINEHRLREAAATGAGEVVSNCPFCLTMFEDGVKTAGLEGALRPRDLAEVIAERLRGGDGP